ncbi:MAG: ABC transporter permease [Verrucomicrobia bacterium]|jgi:oligopeptide transport system permease protein|nr:ABC transporter permease [Verrucomicrobiota bacterium]MDA7679906.1 ABC transporter permease [bacterium]MBT3842505.1 ABC transporter permease [Verrucomicrobiota bacterium]MBT3914608.1 ABC transporter permease [Verrucomicrobiota bacterium]MBT4624894.1 ABC transporter permease [Verrucomicrobiota bacterium]
MNDTPTRPDAPDTVEKGESLWVGAWYRLRKNKMALAGGVFILLLAGLSFIGPFFLEGDYYTNTVLEDKLTAPDAEYTLGTDHLGRDQLGRIIKGGQISLLVGLVATFVSLTIGIGYGTISGYFGGKIDSVMMRIVDILYSLPFVIFVILLMVFAKDLGDSIDEWFRARGSEFSISGQWNMLLLFVAIGAVEWLTMARIVRGQVMSLRRQEFIEACISLGLPTHRILFRHMVPNILGPVIVYTTLTIPAVMLLEAFLSFLGLGVQPPTPSWGLLIKDGADRMREAWWMLVFPGALFAITLFSFNFVGDGLRDALDPKTSKD